MITVERNKQSNMTEKERRVSSKEEALYLEPKGQKGLRPFAMPIL